MFFNVIRQHLIIRRLLISDLDDQYSPYIEELDDCISEYRQAISVCDFKMMQVKNNAGKTQIDNGSSITNKCDVISNILNITVCYNKICSIYYKEYVEIKEAYNKILSYREKLMVEKIYNFESIRNKEFRLIMRCKDRIKEYTNSEVINKIRSKDYLMYKLNVGIDPDDMTIQKVDQHINDNKYMV